MITQGLQPHANTAGEPPIYFLGLPTILRATGQTTNGAFGLVEQLMPPGFASPYHTHRLEDEAFYVLEGEMAFVCGGTWTIARPGTYVFGPRNIPHGFKVLGDVPARMLLLCAPGGFDQFVVEMSEPAPAPPDMAKLMALAAKYKVDIHGPLPEDPQPLLGEPIRATRASDGE
jgi:quercetin dioxygenase-like cupin family protein